MNDSRSSYLDEPLGRFLALVSEATPAPAGGAAAAVAVGLAAALCAMAAGLSGAYLAGAEALAEEAGELRDRAASLGQADAEAYGRVIEARRRHRADRRPDRRADLAAALSGAADVPLEVVEIAARVAGIAAELAEHGNPNLRGDAAAGALLAGAGARSAGLLVRMNLEDAVGDGRPGRVETLLRETAAAVRRAEASVAGAAPPV